MPKHFAKTALGAIPLDSAADRSGGSDDAHARGLKCSDDIPVLAGDVPQSKAAAFDATALFTGQAKISLPTQMLLGAETHGASSWLSAG